MEMIPQNNNNQKTERMEINWQHFNTLPLIPRNPNEQGVLDILGIKYNRAKKNFLCIEHDDHTPSARVSGEFNEKYDCYVCNAHGTALNLVSKALNIPIIKAAIFLDEYYPGGIEKKTEYVIAPIITRTQLSALGLKTNPLTAVYVKNGEDVEKFCIETTEATDMLIDKSLDYKQRILDYVNGVFKNFPDLSKEDKAYMVDKTFKDLEWVDVLVNSFREYERKVADFISAKELDDDTRTR